PPFPQRSGGAYAGDAATSGCTRVPAGGTSAVAAGVRARRRPTRRADATGRTGGIRPSDLTAPWHRRVGATRERVARQTSAPRSGDLRVGSASPPPYDGRSFIHPANN